MHRDAWSRIWQGFHIKAAEVVDEMIVQLRAANHEQTDLQEMINLLSPL